MGDFIYVIIFGTGALIIVLGRWTAWFGSEEARVEAQRNAWVNMRLGQGASMEEVSAEGDIREQLAMLRERVSDYVRLRGADGWEDFLTGEIMLSMKVLSSIDPALGKRFYDVVRKLHHSDILYPAEYNKIYPMPDLPPVTQAQRNFYTRITKAAYTDLR